MNGVTPTTFQDRALLITSRGIPCIPLKAGRKEPVFGDWPTLASTSAEVIEKWNQENSNYNCAAVFQEVGYWALEVDSSAVVKRIERDTGKKLPKTFSVLSSPGRGHLYWKQNAASIAMGNLAQAFVNGEDFSVRVSNQYCVSPLSVHPSGAIYKIMCDAEIVEAPDWLIEWLIAQKTTHSRSSIPKAKAAETIERPGVPITVEPVTEEGIIREHGRNTALTSMGGSLRHRGCNESEIYSALSTVSRERCRPPLPDQEVRTISWSVSRPEYQSKEFPVFIGGKECGGVIQKIIVRGAGRVDVEYETKPDPNIVVVTAEELKSQPPIEQAGLEEDMPTSVLDGRLGEICLERLKRFPVAYSWPALVTVAGVMVPVPDPPASGLLIAQRVMTNLYTGVVGPWHSGKSQAGEWARRVLNLHERAYSDVKAGSTEGLMASLNRLQKNKKLDRSLLVDLDEWSHLFDKAKIDNSSFLTILNTGFYRSRVHLVIAGGKEIDLDCAISWYGGIVQEEFGNVFGVKSMGGAHDRFLFGLCPKNYVHFYRPFEGEVATDRDGSALKPIPVTIHQDVWEMVDGIKLANPGLDREAEIGVRIAHICASFDGRPILHAKDCEQAVKAMASEQCRIKSLLKPNLGVTHDAECSNVLIDWFRKHASDGQWVRERILYHSVRRTFEKLGPNVIGYTLQGLEKRGLILSAKDDRGGPGAKAKFYQWLGGKSKT